MATFKCGSCGNLHGAAVANCGVCGYPGVVLVPEDGGDVGRTLDADERLASANERLRLIQMEEKRQQAEQDRKEKRERADQERADRLVAAGVKLLEALIKLVDRTPALPGATPVTGTLPKV